MEEEGGQSKREGEMERKWKEKGGEGRGGKGRGGENNIMKLSTGKEPQLKKVGVWLNCEHAHGGCLECPLMLEDLALCG